MTGGEPIAFLRDVDGAGSLCVCDGSDPGAFPVYQDKPALAGSCLAAVERSAKHMLTETYEPDETNALFMVEVACAIARGADALEFVARHLHEKEI